VPTIHSNVITRFPLPWRGLAVLNHGEGFVRGSGTLISTLRAATQETLFWRRRVWETIGGLDESFQFALDWDFILRAQTVGLARRWRFDRRDTTGDRALGPSIDLVA
jgi:hypothetical protein